MRKPASMRGLENLGRRRLSRHFFLRDFLYSEIAALNGLSNVPDNPRLVIDRGRAFASQLLDPLEDTFGRVTLRSGYRSAQVNAFGNAQNLNCARNDHPEECHIWDSPHAAVAGATVVIPWFADQFARGRDWRDLAWWIHDHLPYSEMWFFPKLCAFNLSWRPDPWRKIASYVAPRGTLLRRGDAPGECASTRAARYADFPVLRGVPAPA